MTQHVDPKAKGSICSGTVMSFSRTCAAMYTRFTTEAGGDYTPFTRRYGEQDNQSIVVVGVSVLVPGIFLKEHGVQLGMLLHVRPRLSGGVGDSQPLAVLALFRVQKYETWRQSPAGARQIAGAFTRANQPMVRRFSGDVPAPMADVEKVCPEIASDNLWPLLGVFERYAGAILDLGGGEQKFF